jgi:hypothetical protein
MLLLAATLLAYVTTGPSVKELSIEGDSIVAAIERYRDEYSQYPKSLAAAAVHVPATRYGPWRYRVSDDHSWFEISVGDYEGFDPFTLYWSSKTGDWSLDR